MKQYWVIYWDSKGVKGSNVIDAANIDDADAQAQVMAKRNGWKTVDVEPDRDTKLMSPIDRDAYLEKICPF